MMRRDGSSGISPLLDILVNLDTPLPKKRRVLETLTFLAANPAIAYGICEQGGIALLLQVVADPHDGVQLEAAEALQALMVHQCAQVLNPHTELARFSVNSITCCSVKSGSVQHDCCSLFSECILCLGCMLLHAQAVYCSIKLKMQAQQN